MPASRTPKPCRGIDRRSMMVSTPLLLAWLGVRARAALAARDAPASVRPATLLHRVSRPAGGSTLTESPVEKGRHSVGTSYPIGQAPFIPGNPSLLLSP